MTASPRAHPGFVRLTLIVASAGMLAGCHDSTPATPTCTCTVTSSTLSFAAAGGSGSATVNIGASCPWSASADVPWVSFGGAATGVGPGTLLFSIGANGDSTTRRATLTIGGQLVAVSQDGRTPCQFDVTPSSSDFAAAGGNGTIAVTTAAGCTWTAASSDGWVSISGGSAGVGNGTVTFAVAAQTALSIRQATLTVAGHVIVVRQAGAAPPPPPPTNCEYSVSPIDVVEHWHGSGFSLTITTGSGCAWTAAPTDPWISLGRTAGEGSASIGVSYSPFTEDATRRAAIQVRWPTPTAGQNVSVTQGGCRYGFDFAPASIPAAGGTYRVTVVTQAVGAECMIGCPWTAQSNASWVRITSSMPRAGDDAFSYEVEANTGSSRAATIAIAGRTYTVSQAGR